MAEATWSCAPAFVTAECLLRGRMSPCRGAGMERSRLSPATPDCPSLVLGRPDASCGVSFWSEGESRNETDAKVGVNDERAEPRLARRPQPSTRGPDSEGGVALHQGDDGSLLSSQGLRWVQREDPLELSLQGPWRHHGVTRFRPALLRSRASAAASRSPAGASWAGCELACVPTAGLGWPPLPSPSVPRNPHSPRGCTRPRWLPPAPPRPATQE